jgi:uncharacterized phiE125 gp8 family phage protein
MQINRTGPAAAPPVSVAALADHLRLDVEAEDEAALARLLAAAAERVMAFTRRVLMGEDWQAVFDAWPRLIPGAEAVVLTMPRAPLIAVNGFTLIRADGEEISVDADDYVAQPGVPGRLAVTKAWPLAVRLRPLGGIRVAFRAGHGDSAEDVPAALVQAVLMEAAALYTHRGDGRVAPETLSPDARSLAAPFVVRAL